MLRRCTNQNKLFHPLQLLSKQKALTHPCHTAKDSHSLTITQGLSLGICRVLSSFQETAEHCQPRCPALFWVELRGSYLTSLNC